MVDLYIYNNTVINAYIYGNTNTFIAISSEIIETMTIEELYNGSLVWTYILSSYILLYFAHDHCICSYFLQGHTIFFIRIILSCSNVLEM